jgi:hypothetical protein
MKDKDSDNIGLFDLDGSLADYDKAVLEGLALLASPEEPPVVDVRNARQVKHLQARVDLITRQPNWWANLERIPMGFQVLELAREIGFRIHVLTQGPKAIPVAWKEKVEWCHKHLGADTDIHITRDKGLVYGRFLYDDYPVYMQKWLRHRPRGLGIMPVTAANREFVHPQVVRWDGTNLEEVVSRLRAAYHRLSGKAFHD